MKIRSISFDDDDDGELHVFSGNDLLTAHYDLMDLDWQQIIERSLIDERRGLVIAQVAVLEDLIDEFILYAEDPEDIEGRQRQLGGLMIGMCLKRLRAVVDSLGLLDDSAAEVLDSLDVVVGRRNQLAHGALYAQPVSIVPVAEIATKGLDIEWRLVDRRRRTSERVSMAGLRADLEAAAGAFSAMLSYAEVFVERVPRPVNFGGGVYLGPPTP